MSILIATVGAVGLLRGARPASNSSMMTMRPPQHGPGWSGLSVVSVPAGASSGFADRGGCAGSAAANRAAQDELREHVQQWFDQLTPRQKDALGAWLDCTAQYDALVALSAAAADWNRTRTQEPFKYLA